MKVIDLCISIYDYRRYNSIFVDTIDFYCS